MIKLVVNIRESKTLPTLISVILFNEISIALKYDSIASTFKLQMYYDPDNKTHAELTATSHIHECKLYYVHSQPGRYAVGEKRNGEAIFGQTTDQLIITGFMLSTLFSSGPNPSFVEIGGYSKAGVLGDCDFPTRAYPLESIGLSFRQIINNKVIPYFSNASTGGFKFHIKSSRADSIFEVDINKKAKKDDPLAGLIEDADEAIEKTTGAESQNILSYLKDLAVQKGFVLSTDIFGNLVVNVPYSGDDYIFQIGTDFGDFGINVLDINCNYNGQGLHSDIEVVGQSPKDGENQPYASVTNPLVPVVYRPRVIRIQQGTNTECLKAAISERGTELKNIPLKITLASPVVNGKFITPNNTVLVKHKQAGLYYASKWFIEEVAYNLNQDGEKCEITCVLPATYDGSTPINPFIKPGQNIPFS